MKIMLFVAVALIYVAIVAYTVRRLSSPKLLDPTTIVTGSTVPAFVPMREEGQAQHDERYNAYKARLIEHRNSLDDEHHLDAFDEAFDLRRVRGAEWQSEFTRSLASVKQSAQGEGETYAVGGTD